jgi:hypothetical protein
MLLATGVVPWDWQMTVVAGSIENLMFLARLLQSQLESEPSTGI